MRRYKGGEGVVWGCREGGGIRKLDMAQKYGKNEQHELSICSVQNFQ